MPWEKPRFCGHCFCRDDEAKSVNLCKKCDDPRRSTRKTDEEKIKTLVQSINEIYRAAIHFKSRASNAPVSDQRALCHAIDKAKTSGREVEKRVEPSWGHFFHEPDKESKNAQSEA